MGNNRNIFLNGTATTSEQSYSMEVANIYFISNDDETNDLYIGFDEQISDGNYMVIKPDEKFVNDESFNRPCKTLYYKSSSGNVSFRIYGEK